MLFPDAESRCVFSAFLFLVPLDVEMHKSLMCLPVPNIDCLSYPATGIPQTRHLKCGTPEMLRGCMTGLECS